LKNSCPTTRETKAKLNKCLKDSKKNRELIKKENQDLAALNAILHEQEKVFLDKMNISEA
jgi:hypothetical protein